MEFHGGDKVEVCSEEEGFLGSYYAATTVKNLVEEEDMSKHLIETHHNPNAKTHRWSTLLNGLNLCTHPTPKPLTRPLKPSPPLLLIFFFKPNPFLVDGVTILNGWLLKFKKDEVLKSEEEGYEYYVVIAVSKRFKDQVLMLEVPMRGVAPLLEAVKKLRSSSKHVTALHPDFLQLCLLAKGMMYWTKAFSKSTGASSQCSDISLTPFKLFFPFLSSYCLDYFVFMTVVAALASDPNVWNAVWENEALQELLQSQNARKCTLLSFNPLESVADKEYVADNESVGYTDSQDAAVSSKKLTELSDDESETGNSRTGLMDVINNVKLTVVDMVTNVSAYFKKIFSFSSAEHTPDAVDENAGSSTTEKTLGASLMALAVMAVKKGETIFIGQYLFTANETTSVWLEVAEVNGEDVVCLVKNSATLSGLLCTLDVSQIHINLPTLTDKDKEILQEADGVILSRGNLGIDLPPEKVFLFQKTAVFKCNMAGKPAVVTRVVDSMTENLRPTRAEATDVANAILDASYTSESITLLLIAVLIPHSSSLVRSDAILLGAETLRGLYPVETISTVGRICAESDAILLGAETLRGLYLVGRICAEPYMKVASSYSSGKVSELEKYIQTNREMFESDNNLGLVKQVMSSISKEAEMHVLQMVVSYAIILDAKLTAVS
ncbi:hypothetical protein POTOM_043007 [Populus tomentosa]|uniref:Pyruvate kinase n=1 Tax=Populus tomentosa TaxID=118781 RepID=A0A8X7YXP2_POPTO|nr:hypothetical protein POTOM_043007 [Populus tomentosa]